MATQNQTQTRPLRLLLPLVMLGKRFHLHPLHQISAGEAFVDPHYLRLDQVGALLRIQGALILAALV